MTAPTSDFGWTLFLLTGWFWQIGGADWPETVDWMEGKYWRRLGVGLAIGGYAFILLHLVWWWALGIALYSFAVTSKGYGKWIAARRWLPVWALGLGYGLTALPLLLMTQEWAWLWTPLAVSLAWLGVVRWSNAKTGWKLPWKLAEAVAGLATGLACTPALV